MKTDPLVTVVITTFARPDNLVRAIESVLSQTYNNIEIIVVDDNGLGTNFQVETEKVLSPFIYEKKILYIAHSINRNGSAARNTGFIKSKGAYVNFMDDDDYFATEKIERQIEALNLHPEHDACYCNTFIKRDQWTEKIVNDKEGNLFPDFLCNKVQFNTTTVLFRRKVIEELQGFDESFYRHQDWELFVRFFRNHTMAIVYGEPLVYKCKTPNAVTRNPYKSIEWKEKFLIAFKNDIENISEYNDIYKFQYLQLGQALINNKYRKDGLKYIRKALSYKFLSSAEIIDVLFRYIYSFLPNHLLGETVGWRICKILHMRK